MKLTIRHPYLVFPVNTERSVKKLLFLKDGETVCETDIRLDPLTPDFYAYLDVARFMGEELSLEVSPDMALAFREADEIDRPDLYREAFRPRYHFSEKNGWINDPNGLVRDAAGTYHMFYQLNPADTHWGNMHWGHAVSRDMIRWEQKPIALFPDELGTMYSGSGFLDTENAAGFGKNALLFLYTAAGGESLRSRGKAFTQCLAYSTDNGETFTKYEGNPVLPCVRAYRRDPKLVWCEELSLYVMALYTDGNTYSLFTTSDMKHFEELQSFELPGDGECPDFYPMTADDGTRHWICSGASAHYLVGVFRDGRFVPEQDVRSMHSGSVGYAGQTFSSLPDGRRINMVWERVAFPCGMPFASQMSLPTVHTLKKKGSEYVLYAEPAEEVNTLRISPLNVQKTDDGCISEISDACTELTVTLPEHGGNVSLAMLGHTVVFDRGNMELRMADRKIPMEAENGVITVRLYWDICSLEVFAGANYACFRAVTDENLHGITLSGDREASFTGWRLAHIV